MDLTKLREPFAPSDIHWRIGRFGVGDNGPWAMVLAYVDNRGIMDRLDAVCGPGNWTNEFKAGPSGGVLCGISIRMDDGWITKWDGAENSDIEAVKGGLSDAMKRAAVHWGIGRYLYDLDEGWATFFPRKDQARYTHYDKESKTKYFWSPPPLPDWAIPKEDKTTSGATTNPNAVTSPAANIHPPRTTYQQMEDKVLQYAGNDEKLAEMLEWTTTPGKHSMSPEETDRLALHIVKARKRLEAVVEPQLRH